jgi:signal transduction histidine kinase
LRESLDRLGVEVEELRASRERLVVAADSDRRRIERELHDGPQQRLVALAVNLQLARRLVEDDPTAAARLIDEVSHDVQEALDETRRLAERIYPPLLDGGGLGVALRSAAAAIGVPTHVDVSAGAGYPPQVAGTVYFCCVAALERADSGSSATVTVREGEGSVVFEIVASGVTDADLREQRERVESLGGRLTIVPEAGDGTRVSGSLPLHG